MAGTLKKIVDYVRAQSNMKHLAIATMQLLVKEDVNALTATTPDDPEKIALYIEAAKKVLRTDKLDIQL